MSNDDGPRTLSHEEEKDLLRIITKAERAVKFNQDAQTILKTDFELNKIDHLLHSLNDCISNNNKERTKIIKQESEMKKSLEELQHEERCLKDALNSFQIFKPAFPKKYKVTVSSPPLLTYVVVYIANVFETSNTQNEMATSTSNSAVRKISLPTCDHYQTISTAD